MFAIRRWSGRRNFVWKFPRKDRWNCSCSGWSSPIIELIQLNPHSLEPLSRGGDFAEFKRFRQSEDRCIRLDESKYVKRRTFQIGDVIRNVLANIVRYGIIVNFLHPDGLMASSHEKGYNGKDHLECIRISGRPGLFRKKDRNGQVMRFVARPERSKICSLLPMDGKGGLRIGNT